MMTLSIFARVLEFLLEGPFKTINSVKKHKKYKTFKFHKLDPDRCVQINMLVRHVAILLSAGFFCSVQNVQDISSPLYKGSLVLNILYTAEESCTFRDKGHMTNQQIYSPIL